MAAQEIAKFDMYIGDPKDERMAGEKIKELVERNTNITDLYRYDTLYSQMRFRGTVNGKTVSVVWFYFDESVVIESECTEWKK